MRITTPDINTILEDLPYSVAGVTVANEDASYTIVLNARMSHERITEAYKHEMRHIYQDDFEKYDVKEIEANAHNMKGESE